MQKGRLHMCAFGLAAAVAAACTVAPERAIVDRFFAAARLRDTTALSRLSTVTFEPLQQGIVVDFEVTNVTPEQEGIKHVTIAATVKLPDGRVVDKALVMTFRRGVLTDDPEAARRWIVTAISEK